MYKQLRSSQQVLHSLQLQEAYGSYTAMAQRAALLIQSADGAVTTMCRLCEHHVLADLMPSHAQYCKIVTQCKGLAACSDTTLARQLVKLNSASSATAIFGSSSTVCHGLIKRDPPRLPLPHAQRAPLDPPLVHGGAGDEGVVAAA